MLFLKLILEDFVISVGQLIHSRSPPPLPSFLLLVTSVLDFKDRVDPVLCRLWTKDSSDSLLSVTSAKFLAADSLIHFLMQEWDSNPGFQKKWSYSKKLLTFNLSLLFVLRTLIELALFMLKKINKTCISFLSVSSIILVWMCEKLLLCKNELQMTQKLKFTRIFFMLWFSA